MTFRQRLSQSPYSRAALAGAVVAAIVAFVLFQSSGQSVVNTHPKTFFSIDDGKTWFADDAEKIPPFDKDGKQAVRAFVYRCADGTTFVNHLQRFKPDAKRLLEQQGKPDPNRKGGADVSQMQTAIAAGREVKRPGDAQWTAGTDARAAAQIVAIKCPQGGTDAIPLEP